MKLILKKEQEQPKEKTIYEASEHYECVVEYVDGEGDVESILLVKDDNLENVIVFWSSSVYVYSISGRMAIQEVYELIKNDFIIKQIVDIYPVSSSATFERSDREVRVI